MTPPDLRDYLYAHIPLSAAMGVEVVAASPAGVRLAAPLEPNVNHRSTGFGGSASALAILAAWSLVRVRQHARGGTERIVIHHSAMAYLAPITARFEATCAAPDEAAWDALWAAVERRGKGRIALDALLTCGPAEVGRFEGRYVVLR